MDHLPHFVRATILNDEIAIDHIFSLPCLHACAFTNAKEHGLQQFYQRAESIQRQCWIRSRDTDQSKKMVIGAVLFCAES